MSNLKSAEILWEKKHGQFTDNLDSLVYFLKTDATVQEAIAGWDSITNRTTNPFDTLTNGDLTWDSLFASPKNYGRYILAV